MEELLLDVYDNAKSYKEKTKKFYDAMIVNREFEPGLELLLYNSCFKLTSGKLRSKWSGHFVTNFFSIWCW